MVVDPATVRFEFRSANRELPLIAGGMPVFSRKWGLRADGSRIPFDQLAFEQPIGSGPYLIDHYDNGRTITYRRNPAYWGADLPVRVGTNNFERIVYKLTASRGSRRSRPANTTCSSSTSRATGRAATSASVSTTAVSSVNSASITAPACRASS